jgi:hypothetical protein
LTAARADVDLCFHVIVLLWNLVRVI